MTIPSDVIVDRTARVRLAWLLSAIATVVWLVAVLAFGLMSRVAAQWESALTMLFGSFLAGSSPEGGGAVAFPVFTKALDVPGPVARTFGLSIQAVGMSMAAVSIMLSGRPIRAKAVAVGSVAGIVGLLIGALILGRPDELFWPPAIGSAWVKATFSIVLATTSIMMLRLLRSDSTGTGHGSDSDADGEIAWSGRVAVGVAFVALFGGILSSFTGTGANIAVFLFLVVLVGVSPKVALPSAIVVMAAVSVVGFVLFGLIDGQLGVDPVAEQSDLLGLWLAAVPVVVWGAPLGSFVASLVHDRHLVRFVAMLAAVEVATTFLLVPELRTDPSLIIYLVVGLVALPTIFIVCQQRRRSFLAGVPSVS